MFLFMEQLQQPTAGKLFTILPLNMAEGRGCTTDDVNRIMSIDPLIELLSKKIFGA